MTAGKLTMTGTHVTGNQAAELGGGGVQVGRSRRHDQQLVDRAEPVVRDLRRQPVRGARRRLLNLGTATLTGDGVSLNDPDDCAGSGTTTGC